MTAVIGQPLSRVDGRLKVTGGAKYAAEFDVPKVAHGVIVQSTVPKGRIVSIDDSETRRVPGILAVLTHENAPKIPFKMPNPKDRGPVDPKVGDRTRDLQSPDVLYSGQHIAIVVGETLEAAERGAALLRVRYDRNGPAAVTSFEDAAKAAHVPGEAKAGGKEAENGRGDPDKAFAAASVKVDVTYTHPMEHHNAMEPHATIAAWDGDKLTLWDKTQWVGNDRKEVATAFGMPEENVRVISPFVGGAFGSGLRTWNHVILAALAAKEAGRPVKIALTRRQCYTSIGYRPRTVQRFRLGASRDGRLTALIQDATANTSTYEEYAENTADPPQMLYACPNVRVHYVLAPMNVNTPCPMRAPGTVTGNFALEAAMDELAEALGIDPVELRLNSYAERDEHKNLPWSSKSLRECYRAAAERFGWEKRNPKPGSMRDEAGRLVGYGMATAVYPTHRAEATASVELLADGSAVVRSASSDMGPGTYTSMTQVAAETLGLPIEKVRFELGDTDLPKAPVHGGSITMASVGSAVQAACREAHSKLASLAGNTGAPPSPAEWQRLLQSRGMDRLEATGEAKPGDEAKKFSSYAFGAVFAEVRVDPELGEIRVPRIVGAYAAGRIVNPKTARSQCLGGMVQGLGMALLEESEWDSRLGRVINANLAEYLVPVNADVPRLEVIFVDEQDPHVSPLGVKGIAEIAIVGVAPAIANAVWHATGRRFRELPIRPDKLIV